MFRQDLKIKNARLNKKASLHRQHINWPWNYIVTIYGKSNK